MEKARYLHNQALMCLSIARQTSDPEKAERWHLAAVQYFEQALDLKKQKCFVDIQASIGEELRTHLVPTNPLSERILKLLHALNESGDG
jgi:hypothetical protein